MPQLQFGHKEWMLAYSVALRILKAPDQAEDAAQDALMRAFRARDRFEGRARFETWLYRIAYTTAVSYLRRPHYRRRASLPGNHSDVLSHLERLASTDTAPDEMAAARQLASSLDCCLDRMREVDRTAFTERFIRGTSERDLSALLGVSVNAAKQRAFRARRTVRRCMSATSTSGCGSHGETRADAESA